MNRPAGDTRRRSWSRTTIGMLSVLALVLAACGGDDGGTAEPDDASGEQDDASSLTILEWGGYEEPSFHPQFVENHPDVELDFQFGDSDADFLTKVQAGGVSPSLVHPCGGWVGLWVEEGLAQPLDTSLLSNWDDIDESLAEVGQIDGEQYFAPYDWGYTSLVAMTSEADAPTSWKALWDDEFAGRIAFWDDPEEAVITTAYAWDIDPYDMDDDDFEFVREKLEELHENVKTYWTGSSEVNQLLIDGEVDLAQVWTETYAAVIEEGLEATYIEPEEGRLGWVCGFIVLDEPGTARYELAHEYIDAMLDPSGGVNLVNDWYYGHSNLVTVDQADEYVVDLIQLDQFDVRERTNFYQSIGQEEREKWSRMWTEVTAG
jgi:spermidine/putrescine transport system substrate-binding protein